MTGIVLFVAVLFSPVLLSEQAANHGSKSSQFEKKLTGDREILHALNRLAYGPRPGDVEAVKKMGLKSGSTYSFTPSGSRKISPLQNSSNPLCPLRRGAAGSMS